MALVVPTNGSVSARWSNGSQRTGQNWQSHKPKKDQPKCSQRQGTTTSARRARDTNSIFPFRRNHILCVMCAPHRVDLRFACVHRTRNILFNWPFFHWHFFSVVIRIEFVAVHSNGRRRRRAGRDSFCALRARNDYKCADCY